MESEDPIPDSEWLVDRSSTDSTIKSMRSALLIAIQQMLILTVGNNGTLSEHNPKEI